MMAVNEIVFTVFLSLVSTVVMLAKRVDSGWISGNQTVTQYDSNVTLTCYSDHSLPAEWWFSHNDSRAVPIYVDKIIQPRWRGKYDIAVGFNFYNLSIVNVSLDNDGRYECREGSGVRNTEWHSLYLHVNDIDECMTKRDNCSQYANCTNTVGSFQCSCQNGFTGSGYECTDVDECYLAQNGGCGEHSHCLNNVGSFSCPCDEGFKRSGSECIESDGPSTVWIAGVVIGLLVILAIIVAVWKRRELRGCYKNRPRRNEDPLLTATDGCDFSHELKEALCDFIDADFGLLENLRADLERQYESIVQYESHERNAKLMDYVHTLQKDHFLSALQATSQQHVVNYINKLQGQRDTVDHRCFPLTKEQYYFLEKNMFQLTDLINFDPLLNEICAEKCITQRHFNYIREVLSQNERSTWLLRILMKRSQVDYYSVSNVLEKNGHKVIARSFREGGGVLTVHVELVELDEPLVETVESQLEARFKAWVEQTTPQERHELLTKLKELGEGVTLVAMRKSNSVSVFIHLATLSAVERLNRSREDGQLESVLEDVFSILLDGRRCEIRELQWTTTNYDSCLSYFHKTMKSQGSYNARIVKLRSQLLLRLSAMEVAGLMFERDALNRLQLDAVLVHSSNPTQAAETLLHFLMELRDDLVTDSFLSALEETDQHDLYRCIKDGDNLDLRHIQVLQEHHTFLLHNMRVDDELIDRLFSLNVLSYLQREELKTCRRSLKQSEKLLSLLARKSSNQFQAFLKVLADLRHDHVASELSMALSAKDVDAYLARESGDEMSEVRTGQHLDNVGREDGMNTDFPGFLKRLQQLYRPMIERLSANPVAVELYQRRVLSQAELEKVNLSPSPSEAAKCLLDLLLDSRNKDSYDCFLNVLKATHQEHLFLWLTDEGFDIDCQHSDLIRQNYSFLRDHLCLEGDLIAHLFQQEVIDQRETGSIENDSNAVERFLSVLSRKSAKQFELFLIALQKTDHDYIAEELRRQSFIRYPGTRVINLRENGMGNVTGLTVHGNELFVVRSRPQCRIEVYDVKDFTFSRSIGVTELGDGRSSLRGLTSCGVNSCLYVLTVYRDARSGSVVRVALTDNNSVDKWKINDDGEPLGLSVNSQHNLIVSCDGPPHKLIEYTTRGESVREITLQDDLNWPWHAIQLNDGQYLVSHGRDRSLHRVCAVDAQGRVLRSYGKDAGRGAEQLDEPKQIAVGRNGFIYVADWKNNRLVVLDSTLTWSRDISSRFVTPCAFYLDEQRKQLFLGEERYPYAKVFVLTV